MILETFAPIWLSYLGEQTDMAVRELNYNLDESATLFAVAEVFNYRKEMSIRFRGVFNNANEAKAYAYKLCNESKQGRMSDDGGAFDCWLDGNGYVYYTGTGYDRNVYWVYALPAVH